MKYKIKHSAIIETADFLTNHQKVVTLQRSIPRSAYQELKMVELTNSPSNNSLPIED
ncbi:MAG: hypothetical protein ACI808_002568 [Paraglaciecola sp.]|jgi:hypothetical protein